MRYKLCLQPLSQQSRRSFDRFLYERDSVSQIMALSPSNTKNFQSILYYSFRALRDNQYFKSQLNVQYTLKILEIFNQ